MSLQKIQTELNANKSQYNEFSNFYYRSCEDILAAVKPLLAEYEYSILINDSIEQTDDRIYVRARATIRDSDGGVVAETVAFAREPKTKKGMDESQITGAASSYARKYALNGLLAIDDTLDSDSVSETEAEDIEKKQPRTPHATMLGRFKKAMDEAATVGALKAQYTPAYAYFKKWDEAKYTADVHKHYKKLEGTFKAGKKHD